MCPLHEGSLRFGRDAAEVTTTALPRAESQMLSATHAQSHTKEAVTGE